jgi:hypothetical protein
VAVVEVEHVVDPRGGVVDGDDARWCPVIVVRSAVLPSGISNTVSPLAAVTE